MLHEPCKIVARHTAIRFGYPWTASRPRRIRNAEQLISLIDTRRGNALLYSGCRPWSIRTSAGHAWHGLAVERHHRGQSSSRPLPFFGGTNSAFWPGAADHLPHTSVSRCGSPVPLNAIIPPGRCAGFHTLTMSMLNGAWFAAVFRLLALDFRGMSGEKQRAFRSADHSIG